MKSTVLSVLFGLLVLLGTCSGKGFLHQSRSHLCHASAGNKNKNCGAVAYEPQMLKGSKGFPGKGPKDGFIASANIRKFHALDEFGADRWTLTPIKTYVTGEKDGKLVLDFPWTITARQVTTRFEYFISKPTFDPTKELTRDQLDLTPFCVDKTAKGTRPPENYISHNCELDAANYSGHHVILGVWVIRYTSNSFYQVIDVDFPAKPEDSSESEDSMKSEDSLKIENSSNSEDSSESEDSSNSEDSLKIEKSSNSEDSLKIEKSSISEGSAMQLIFCSWRLMAFVLAILFLIF